MTKVKKMLKLTPVRTAKVKFKKGVCLGNGEDAAAGDIYELPKHIASQLVSTGQAEYTDEGDPSEHDDPGADAHRQGYQTATLEPPTDRDPKPKKKG